MVGFTGASVREPNFAELTVKFAVADSEPYVAVTVTVPGCFPRTIAFFRIEATLGLEERQFPAVSACVLPSLKAPIKVNCKVVPVAIVAEGGSTAIETKVTEMTFRVVEPLTAPAVAVMVDVPIPTALARPRFEMVATDATDELHTMAAVTS
jgi:hypothetical protein